MTNLLLETLINSAPSRIVTVSSGIHKGVFVDGEIDFEDLNAEKSYQPWTAYARSKTANILFSTELAKRLEGEISYGLFW